MIFEQKLVISKIWAKKALKIAKMGVFPNFGESKILTVFLPLLKKSINRKND